MAAGRCSRPSLLVDLEEELGASAVELDVAELVGAEQIEPAIVSNDSGQAALRHSALRAGTGPLRLPPRSGRSLLTEASR